jgi:DNA primase large subunit
MGFEGTIEVEGDLITISEGEDGDADLERFLLANFMNHAGIDEDEVVRLFHGMPDFDEAYTRYQVSYSVRGKYKPANCGKLKAAAMCPAGCGLANPINFDHQPTAQDLGRDQGPVRWPVARTLSLQKDALFF